MSKYVKYVSSDHYGAPVMKGDRFGYLVEMLRTVLCTGFNEHTDVKKIEVLTEKTFKVTFETAHNYVKDQTLKFSNASSPELNDDCVVISNDELSVTCESYNDLSGIIGQTYDFLSNVNCVVSPLGFIEKFKDGNRSAFTTDEEEAFLYIDDNTPANWDGALATNRTPLISPIVYMTDKMTDIDTDGKYIVPFDSNNPTYYKNNSFLSGTSRRNGIWNWITYGLSGTTGTGNLVAERSVPLKYSIIGNGRFFYFIPEIQWTLSNIYPQIYYFGKINSDHNINNNLPYILNTAPYMDIVYNSAKISTTNYMYAPANYQSNSYTLSIDIGQFTQAVLKMRNTSSAIFIKPTVNNTASISVSGSTTINKMSYPDTYTKKLYVSRLKVNSQEGYIGNLSGLLHVSNINPIYFNHGKVVNFNKKMFTYNGLLNDNSSGGASNSRYIYFISLDYKDWENYE